MATFPGGSDDPSVRHLEYTRRRVRSRAPFVIARLQRILCLAAIAAAGPDPESALPQLEAAQRTLATFLKLTPL